MAKQTVTSVCNGKYELITGEKEQELKGRFGAYGNNYNTDTLTEAQCKFLLKKGYKRIRAAEGAANGETPSKEDLLKKLKDLGVSISKTEAKNLSEEELRTMIADKESESPE
jgi:hypothetical protein